MTLLPGERQAVISLRLQNADGALLDAGVLLDRGSLTAVAGGTPTTNNH